MMSVIRYVWGWEKNVGEEELQSGGLLLMNGDGG